MLDDLRARFPHLGFGLYMLDPAGPVTLEVYAADGQVFAFKGDTVAGVLGQAFPPLAPAEEPTEDPVDLFS